MCVPEKNLNPSRRLCEIDLSACLSAAGFAGSAHRQSNSPTRAAQGRPKQNQMIDARAATSSSASQSTVDAQLVLDALRHIQADVGSMKASIENVERTGQNNANRLETIDALLRARAAAKSRPEMETALAHSPAVPPQACDLTTAAAAAVAFSLLISPRVRKLLLRGLKSLPLSLVALAQLSSGMALLVYRGYDALDRLVGSDSESEDRERVARRRALVYAVLLLSVASVPAKGVAHALLALPARTPARGPKYRPT